MKKIILFLLFCIFIPISGFAFEIKDLSGYQNIAIKNLTEWDLPKHNNNQIQSTKELVKIMGDEKKYFDTDFIYKGSEEISQRDKTTWYFSKIKSNPGRRKYSLYYRHNDVMAAGKKDDILIIAKKSDSEILFLIIKKDSEYEKQLYESLNIKTNYKTDILTDFDKNTTKENYDISKSQLPDIPPISNKTWVRIYFSPGNECENNIISEFNNAKKSVNIAVYAINNPKIFNALSQAHSRGVKIQVITDRLESSKKNAKIITNQITDLNIPVRKNKKYKIEHNKFAIFDNKNIVTGSYNWTVNASNTNSENCLFFEQPNQEYSDRFNYLWDFYEK